MRGPRAGAGPNPELNYIGAWSGSTEEEIAAELKSRAETIKLRVDGKLGSVKPRSLLQIRRCLLCTRIFSMSDNSMSDICLALRDKRQRSFADLANKDIEQPWFDPKVRLSQGGCAGDRRRYSIYLVLNST